MDMSQILGTSRNVAAEPASVFYYVIALYIILVSFFALRNYSIITKIGIICMLFLCLIKLFYYQFDFTKRIVLTYHQKASI